MNKCYLCGKTIYDSGRAYRNQLDTFRKQFKNESINVCDKCIKTHSMTLDKAINSTFTNISGCLYEKLY